MMLLVIQLAIATGNDGMVLTSTGAGSPPAFETVSGTTINNNADNKVITGSGTANTLEGETNFIYNGTIVGAGATGASADLGVGLHVRTADSGASVHGNADELVIENSGDCGISILSSTNDYGNIYFGDSGDNNIGQIGYNHNANWMQFFTNASERMRITSGGGLCVGTATEGAKLTLEQTANGQCFQANATNGSFGQTVVRAIATRNTTDGSFLLFEGANGGGSKFFVQDSGNVTNANNSYGQSSDERIKKDIIDANSQWDDIKAVKVKNFKYKSNDSITQLGVVAQDLETSGMNGLIHDSLPTTQDIEADSTFGTLYTEQDKIDENIPEDKKVGDVKEVKEKVKSVKYSVLYMKAIKALQESMERIEQLEAKVTTLENA